METVSSACTAGLIAITRAAEMISAGKIDIALCGGADAPVSPFAVASFAASGMVPLEQGDPSRASRPFDLNRAGGVMSEGAAMVVLESLSHARAHGRDPKVMLTGFGQSIDAPGSQPASGLAESMTKAIANAGLYESEIQYICAHAPSDPVMDKVETDAIKDVFGQRAYEMAVSSIKGVTGNPLSAAGPMSLAACVKAVQEGYLPPTANYETPDPDCDLDCVPNRSRVASVRKALVNIHEMGGGNCSIVLEALNGS